MWLVIVCHLKKGRQKLRRNMSYQKMKSVQVYQTFWISLRVGSCMHLSQADTCHVWIELLKWGSLVWGDPFAVKPATDCSWEGLNSQYCVCKYYSNEPKRQDTFQQRIHMHFVNCDAKRLLTMTQTYLFKFRISLQTHQFGSWLWCLRQERAWVIKQFRVTSPGHTVSIQWPWIHSFATCYWILGRKRDLNNIIRQQMPKFTLCILVRQQR